jgi:carbon monoxide dehydrogenase subunit G
MVRFEGDKDFPQQPADLWNKLRDAAFLVDCIPDSSIEGQPERDRAQCTVRPGFTFVRGTLDVTLQIVEAQEPTLLKIQILGKGIGSSSDVDATLNFSPQAQGTRVHWQAEIKSLGGLLKMAPAGLIRGAAQKVIEDVWTCAAQKVV